LQALPQDALVLTEDQESRRGDDYDGWPDWYGQVEVDYSPLREALPASSPSGMPEGILAQYAELSYGGANGKGRSVVVIR
jgi:hypothetical protein